MTACLHIMVKKVNKLIKTIFDCITCLCFYVLRGQDHRTQLVLNMGIIYTGPRPSGNILQKKNSKFIDYSRIILNKRNF